MRNVLKKVRIATSIYQNIEKTIEKTCDKSEKVFRVVTYDQSPGKEFFL